MNLTLNDDGAFGLVSKFDWVLDSNNMFAFFTVDLVNLRGQGGRLAGASRTGDENEATWVIGKGFDDGWHT